MRDILESHPHLQGTLLDLPGTVRRAQAALGSEGALADRVALTPGASWHEPELTLADCEAMISTGGTNYPDREAAAQAIGYDGMQGGRYPDSPPLSVLCTPVAAWGSASSGVDVVEDLRLNVKITRTHIEP